MAFHASALHLWLPSPCALRGARRLDALRYVVDPRQRVRLLVTGLFGAHWAQSVVHDGPECIGRAYASSGPLRVDVGPGQALAGRTLTVTTLVLRGAGASGALRVSYGLIGGPGPLVDFAPVRFGAGERCLLVRRDVTFEVA